MSSDPKFRASDADRDRVADQLREHHAVGRLDAEEFRERLDKAFTAKTVGDLDELIADLPAVDTYPLPTASLPRTRRSSVGLPSDAVRGAVSRRGQFSRGWAEAWGSWLTVTLVCFVIWGLTGAGYPWPVWVAGPWGAVLLARWISRSRPGDPGGRR